MPPLPFIALYSGVLHHTGRKQINEYINTIKQVGTEKQISPVMTVNLFKTELLNIELNLNLL